MKRNITQSHRARVMIDASVGYTQSRSEERDSLFLLRFPIDPIPTSVGKERWNIEPVELDYDHFGEIRLT